jgi:hypothetical protein
MGRIRISGKRGADGRLVGVEFRNGAGAFTLSVRDDNGRDNKERRRLTFAEWCDANRRQNDAATAPRLVCCSVCGVPMPEPPNPDGDGICLFDTCESCLAKLTLGRLERLDLRRP